MTTAPDRRRTTGLFVHPVCEPGVIIGNGTIGLEIAEDWPDMTRWLSPSVAAG